MPSAKPWYVYMIECGDGSIYTGVAVDVVARYGLHVAGKGARYTRSHPPRRLIAVQEQADRGTALRTERALKKLSPQDKRAFALLHPPAVTDTDTTHRS